MAARRTYPLGSRFPGGRCEICDVEIRASFNWDTGRHATRCRRHVSVGRRRPRRDVIDRVRAEIERDGADAFVRARVFDVMPDRLMHALADVPLVEEARLQRNPGKRLTWTPPRRAALACLARGLRNAEIAAEMGVSVETVKTHLKTVYALLGARGRADAVVIALRDGHT